MLNSLKADDTFVPEQTQFTHHRGPVTCACHVPNTHLVVTSAYDGAVGLFNQISGEVELLGYHAHLVNRVSVDSSGRRAASCSSDFDIYLWDIENRSLLRKLKGHSDDVEDFIFINNDLGASVSRDYRIIVWNLNTGAIEHIFLGHSQDVLSISYLDGKLYTSGDDMTLRIWDLEKKLLLKTLGPFDTETDTCCIDATQQRVILGCDDGCIRVFDIHSGENIATIQAHTAGIKKVACSPVNGDILSAAYDQKIFIWDASQLALKKELQHKMTIWERSFNWSTCGNHIIAGTFDGTVLQWNATTGEVIKETGGATDKNLKGNACFNDVALLDNELITTVSDDGLIRTGKLTKDKAFWQHIHTPEKGRILMNAVCSEVLEQDKSIEILTGTHGQSLQRYSMSAGGLKQTLAVALQQGPINCIRVAHQKNYAGQYFVACYSGSILRVDREGVVLDKICVHENAVKALALHPDRAIGVSCSADGVLASWSFEGECLRTYPGHLAIVDDVDISPNAQLIASAGRDFTLKIHSLEDGSLLHNIGLGRRSPKALEFLENDIVIVTNYWGELLRVDLKSHSVMRKTIAENGLSSLRIRGEHIVTSSYDGNIYLVDGHSLEVINTLHGMTQRIDSPAYV